MTGLPRLTPTGLKTVRRIHLDHGPRDTNVGAGVVRMLIGHFAVRVRLEAPGAAGLGGVAAGGAALLLDLLWPVFLTAALESVDRPLPALLYVSTAVGPPPPNVEMIKIVGLVAWLFVPWAWWFDRRRNVICG